VTTVHGASVHKSSKNSLCRRQIQSTFECSDGIVFNSSVLHAKAKKFYSGLERAHIVPNGVPLTEVYSATPAELPASFSEDRLVLTSLGRLSAKKGQDDVFRALQRLPADAQANYLLLGDGPHRETLEQEAEKVKFPVHFTGKVPHETVFSYLKSTDIMVLPSTDEAFGIAYIEAMACGSPVIGCEGEGPSDFIKDGETGYLVPPDDPTTIADILQELSEDQNKLDQMGDAARKYVLENLTWEENARRNKEIYEQAIEQF
jgi:glycosyltransferase involved in cell wall biosynthesis